MPEYQADCEAGFPLHKVFVFSVLFFCTVHLFAWLCWVFVAACGLSVYSEVGPFLSCGAQASPRSATLVAGTAPRFMGFSSCSHTGLVALRHVEPSWPGDRTCVPAQADNYLLYHQRTSQSHIFNTLSVVALLSSGRAGCLSAHWHSGATAVLPKPAILSCAYATFLSAPPLFLLYIFTYASPALFGSTLKSYQAFETCGDRPLSS